MAEPIKFVQLDCHFDDDKFDFIEAQFGLKGFAIIVKLFQKIYGGLGYYCEWNDRVGALFAKNCCCGVGGAFVQEVVKAAINERIFDGAMYEKYGILTSRGIQKRFYSVAKRREVVFDKPEYVLFIPYTQKSDNSDDVDISAPNVCNETTSKVKVSKGKRSEGKVSKSPPSAALTAENRKILIDQYGKSAVDEYEKRFDKWRASKIACNADAFNTISKWLREDKPEQKEQGHSSFHAEDVEQAINEKYKKLGGKKDDDEI